MEQATATANANELPFELARWYHDLARICLQAAEEHLYLNDDSPKEDVDRAMAVNDVIRMRILTMQSVEESFRCEFTRHYIDRQVEQILER